jgi:hypothetical protein
MWNLVSVYLETVLVSVQDSWMVCAKRTYAQKLIWTHPMEARFVPFGIGANLAVR